MNIDKAWYEDECPDCKGYVTWEEEGGGANEATFRGVCEKCESCFEVEVTLNLQTIRRR